jgi:hypothetical protein
MLSELRSDGIGLQRLASELKMSTEDLRDLILGLVAVAV